MIDKNIVRNLVEEWLEDKEYFLVDVMVDANNKVVVEIDHAEGVWIEDCVELSRFIESRMDRDAEDYELEVGSAGIGQPFKVVQQYINHVGKEGKKLVGVLKDANDSQFVVSVPTKVKEEGAKRPKLVDIDETFTYDNIKYTKYLISFK